jgi:dihydroorotate dehydrogenase electron transfer subunit
MPFILDCEITRHESIAHGHYRLFLRSPELAAAAVPGQFCMIQVVDSYVPFLRRPMCFERILHDGVAIVYKVEGEGTRLLSQVRPGRSLSVQGPLGHGFPIDCAFDRHIIVAGGIGVAPFPALAEALVNQCERAPEVVLAARSKDLIICEEEFRAMGCGVHLATDDGSAGIQAFACDALAQLLPGPDTRVYVCGPMVMMRTTSDVALAAGADCLVSLEAQMACGDGACLGCVVEANVETDGEPMVRVCWDGPVFDTRIINWEAHNLAYDR